MGDKELDITMIETDGSEAVAIYSEGPGTISAVSNFHEVNDDLAVPTTESQMGDKLFSLLNQLEEKLLHMEEVLSQIDSFGYGQCEQCHGEIEHDLLVQNPYIRRCKLHGSPAVTDV